MEVLFNHLRHFYFYRTFLEKRVLYNWVKNPEAHQNFFLKVLEQPKDEQMITEYLVKLSLKE